MGFAAKTTTADKPFLQEYAEVLDSNEASGVTKWLLSNYRRMNEAMFYDAGWETLSPDEIITLRIYTPVGVFNETAKNGFLTRVGSDPQWATVTKSVFTPSDFAFLSNLPEDRQAEAKTLLIYAYNRHIRMSDAAVAKMP